MDINWKKKYFEVAVPWNSITWKPVWGHEFGTKVYVWELNRIIGFEKTYIYCFQFYFIIIIIIIMEN